MDLLTHVLFAYLVTFGLVGFQPQYLAAGALAGGLPDADALLFLVARRFPLFRHRGITHSFVGVTAMAVAGALLAPLLAPGSPFVYFVVMEIGGLTHIALDGFTNFAVPPLLPFSKKLLRLDADRAVNLFMTAFSAVSFYVLLGIERNHVAFALYLATVDGLAVYFAVYLAVRAVGRWTVGRHAAAIGPNGAVIPTTNPFVWGLISETTAGGRLTTTWARYALGRGLVDGPFSVAAPLAAPAAAGAPASAQEALDRSYALARARSRAISETYHFGDAALQNGAWTVVWYSLEYSMFGRCAGVRVRFPADGGAPLVQSAFYRPVHRAF